MTGVIFLLGVLVVLIAVGLLIVVVKNLDWCDLTDYALGMVMGCMCLMILLLGVLMIAATTSTHIQ